MLIRKYIEMFLESTITSNARTASRDEVEDTSKEIFKFLYDDIPADSPEFFVSPPDEYEWYSGSVSLEHFLGSNYWVKMSPNEFIDSEARDAVEHHRDYESAEDYFDSFTKYMQQPHPIKATFSKDGSLETILDGNHRVAMANRLNMASIPAVFGVKRK